MQDYDRFPRLRSWQFVLVGLFLAAALYLLRTYVSHLLPNAPLWVRSLLAFLLCGWVGEKLVQKYWPRMRGSLHESYQVVSGFLQVGLILSVLTWSLQYFMKIAISPEPVAWMAYMSVVLFDGMFRW